MGWLAGLNVRDILILVGALLLARAGASRARRLPHLLRETLTQCAEIALVSVVVNGQTVLMASVDGRATLLGRALVVNGHMVRELAPLEALRQRSIRARVDGFVAEGTVLSPTRQPRLLVVRGRRLSLRPGHVCINGRPLPETYPRETPRYAMAPLHLGPGHYLVLG